MGNIAKSISAEEKQYVVFGLDAELFGVDINNVKEIITYRETTRLPGMGRYIQGIINLRGHIIPVFSLRRKFNLPDAELTASTRIVVVEVYGGAVGVVVDDVTEVVMLPDEVVEQPTGNMTGIDAGFIRGVAKTEEKLIILLNVETVVSIGAA